MEKRRFLELVGNPLEKFNENFNEISFEHGRY
jgi:hypothetical protein